MKPLLCLWVVGTFLTLAQAQFLPSPQLCNETDVSGAATGQIDRHGSFDLVVEISCRPDDRDRAFPQGTVSLFIELNDPRFSGQLTATVIEGARTVGRVSPLAFISGQCALADIKGCRFWLFLADNDHAGGVTPDVVSFIVLDSDGSEVAYASGPAQTSSLSIKAER